MRDQSPVIVFLSCITSYKKFNTYSWKHIVFKTMIYCFVLPFEQMKLKQLTFDFRHTYISCEM